VHFSSNLINYLVQFRASRSLGVFDVDRQDFHGLLLRLALSDGSEGSKSVLHSVLAFSSIHRFGLQSEAARLKGKALMALATSLRHGINTNVAMQHIAAQMILCYFEVCVASNHQLYIFLVSKMSLQMQNMENMSIQWVWYVCGSKNLMQNTQLASQVSAKEYVPILDWVDYHVIINKFSMKHWHRMSEVRAHSAGSVDRQPVVCKKSKVYFRFSSLSLWKHGWLTIFYIARRYIQVQS
jgi:hypothetical protein